MYGSFAQCDLYIVGDGDCVTPAESATRFTPWQPSLFSSV